MNSDFKELLQIFNDCEVKYLIVGGYAVIQYTEPRYTKDLDIWIEASAENAAKTFAALKKFNAPLFDLKAEDFAEEGFFYMMGRPPSRIDILMSLAGVTFHEAWEKKKIISIDPQLQTYFISKDDLIKNKRSAGRDVDIIDVKRLETSN